VACRDAPAPPSQDAVNQAWKRSDQAVEKAADAEVQVRHLRRLRDLDRLRFDTETAELTTAVWWLQGVAALLVLGLLVLMIWLAVEIRRRRALSTVVIRLGGFPSQHIDGPEAIGMPFGVSLPCSPDDRIRANGRESRFSSHPRDHGSFGGYDGAAWGQPWGSAIGSPAHDGFNRYDLAPNGSDPYRSPYDDPFWDPSHPYAGQSSSTPPSPYHGNSHSASPAHYPR
jgi:hypothetical protein